MRIDKMNGMVDSKLVHALDACFYTDPEIFERERTSLLPNSWQFACHESEIPQIGDFCTFELNGESFFCIRTHEHEIRTFYNVCQHRAHQLVEGKGSKRIIVCPYHAWTYELTGELRSGPNLASVPGFDRSQICLQSIRTEVFHGFVFVNECASGLGMRELYPGVHEELQEILPMIADLEPLLWKEIPEACNWKISVENYCECYHCSINHPAFVFGVVKPESYDIQPVGYCLKHTTEAHGLESLNYLVDPSMSHADEYRSYYLWPVFSFQVYPGNVLNTYHWRADDVGHCTVWRGWYSVNGEDNQVIRGLADQDLNTTVAEDVRLVESVARGINSRGYRPGPLVVDPACGLNSEHSLAILHRWMREGAVSHDQRDLERQT